MFDFPVAASTGRAAYVAGTFDTKGRELYFLRQCLEKLGLRVVTVDLATSGKPSTAAIHPREVARHHPDGEAAVFSGDRGSAVTAMAVAFARFVATRSDLGGLIGAGGSGGAADTTTLGIASLDITSASTAATAVAELTDAVALLGEAQSTVGSLQNRLQFAISLAQSQIVNTKAAESRIRDANIAEESANLTKFSILTQSGIAALAQANQMSGAVLSLLR